MAPLLSTAEPDGVYVCPTVNVLVGVGEVMVRAGGASSVRTAPLAGAELPPALLVTVSFGVNFPAVV